MKNVLMFLCFSLVCLSLKAAPLDELRSSITLDMERLRAQLRLLDQSLTQAKEGLALAYGRSETLRAQLSELTRTYDSTLRRLTSCEAKLTLYEKELKGREKTILALAIILAAMTAAKVAVGALRLRGVRLPWLVDWLA